MIINVLRRQELFTRDTRTHLGYDDNCKVSKKEIQAKIHSESTAHTRTSTHAELRQGNEEGAVTGTLPQPPPSQRGGS